MAETVESKDSKDMDNKLSTDTNVITSAQAENANTDTNVNTSAKAEQSTSVDQEMSVDDGSLPDPFEGMTEEEKAKLMAKIAEDGDAEMISNEKASTAGLGSIADTTAKLNLESTAQNQGSAQWKEIPPSMSMLIQNYLTMRLTSNKRLTSKNYMAKASPIT